MFEEFKSCITWINPLLVERYNHFRHYFSELILRSIDLGKRKF